VEENKPMKTIKIIALLLSIGLVSLFGYANIRRLSIIETLEPVNLASLKINGHVDSEGKLDLEKKISAVPGVTACTLSKEGNMASVIFHPKQVTVEALTSLLSNGGELKISQIELAQSGGGCPVRQLNSSFNKVISFLDIRN
jgi:hypothetical protein